MDRILYVVGGVLSRGGTEAFIMNYYRHMDRSKIQIDFIVHGYAKGVYDDEIEALGGIIYHVPIKTKNPIKNAQMIYKICRSGRYKIIHVHMDAMSYVPLKVAEKCGIPIRIAHSHNTSHTTNNKIKKILNDYARKRLPSVATHYFACSNEAARWLFGEKKHNQIQVVPNAIDVDKFKYNEQIRNAARDRMGFTDMDIVLGHIGRYEYQKNHEYLVEVFYRLWQKSKRYRLVLVGNGSLKDSIREKVNNYGLRNAVTFIDACENANEYYNIFDLFCMPSHFEGLGIVLIEAQCNGLQCIVSDMIPAESDVTGNVKFIPISLSAIDLWVNDIIGTNFFRDLNADRRIIDSGYSIHETAKKLQEKYQQLIHDCLIG